MAAKKKARKKSPTKKRRSAKQRAATKKLVALNKARARQKKGSRGLGVYEKIASGRKKKTMVIPIFTEVCVKGHEGKMYKVDKITSTCPAGFHNIRTRKS